MCRVMTAFQKKDVRTLVTWGIVWPFTRCLHDAIVMAIGVAAALMWQWFCPVSHELNMISFVWSSMRLSHRLYKLKPITSISEMAWHLECGRDFEVNRNCKKTTMFFGKQTSRKNTERRDWLHICCTMRANISFAICGNAECFGCGKAIRGNLRNVPHLIFRKLPLDNFLHSAFRNPHSAKYPHV